MTPNALNIADDVKAIESWFDQYLSAVRAHDLDSVLALYDSNPVFSPQGQPTISGITAVADWVQALFDNFEMEIATYTLSPEEIVVDNNLGYARGNWAFDKGSGKFLNIFKRQSDGSWKFKYSIWNDGPQ